MEHIDNLKQNPFKYAESLSVNELVDVLTYLSDKYYNGGKSVLPDKVFDGMIEILEKKDKTNKLLSKIGAKTKRSVKLPYYTGSLDKIKPDSDVVDKWSMRYQGPYIVSDKLDGVSCVTEKKPFGLKLYTRGDGEYGSDITHLKEYVLPKSVTEKKIPDGTIIRGELIISKADFVSIESIMENARNAVSGLANSKKINKRVAAVTQFIAYNIIYPEMKQDKQLETLEEYGFNVVNYKSMKSIDNDKLSKHLVQRREKGDYEVDGIVVVDNSKPYKTQKGNPEYAFAFKSILTNESAEVQVKEVEWNVSKDGYLKPKIKIAPVKLSGVTITSLTGFNAKYIEDNTIGPGSVLEIIRSGDVIPHIKKVIEKSVDNEPQMPDTDYVWNSTGVDIVAKNKNDNNDVVVKRLTYFFKTLKIKYLDEKTIEKLVENEFDNVIDILTGDKTDIILIEGIGERLIDKIRENAFRQLANTNLETLMAASQTFGRGLGARKLKKILTVYPNIIDLSKQKKEKLVEIITEIDGFDSKTAKQFAEGIKEFVVFFKEISGVINTDYLLEKKKTSSDKLGNEVVVFTGVRNKDAESYIEKNGGRVSTSVSKNTTILVHADNISTLTAKMKDAKDKGVKLMTLTEFMNRYKIKIE